MVNTDDFIKRLEIILDYYSLSASAFADKINVQRSSLSHLLSGRNKPSLDLILKIVESFPEVDLHWIINGKGEFPKSENTVIQNIATSTPTQPNLFEEAKIENTTDLFSTEHIVEKNRVFENFEKKISNSEVLNTQQNSEDTIEKIVVFYKNGTFKSYQQKASI